MTTPEPITVFGRSVPFRSMTTDDSLYFLYGDVSIAVFKYTDGCRVVAQDIHAHCGGPRRPTLEEAEQAWLELASLETPLLANRVLDGMTK